MFSPLFVFSMSDCTHKNTTIATKVLSWVWHSVSHPWQKFRYHCDILCSEIIFENWLLQNFHRTALETGSFCIQCVPAPTWHLLHRRIQSHCRRQFSKSHHFHKKITISMKFLTWVRHSVPHSCQKFHWYCALFVLVARLWKLTSTVSLYTSMW